MKTHDILIIGAIGAVTFALVHFIKASKQSAAADYSHNTQSNGYGQSNAENPFSNFFGNLPTGIIYT